MVNGSYSELGTDPSLNGSATFHGSGTVTVGYYEFNVLLCGHQHNT